MYLECKTSDICQYCMLHAWLGARTHFEQSFLDKDYTISIVNVVGWIPSEARHGQQEHAVIEERVAHVHERAVWRKLRLSVLIHGRGGS